jgi:hypothetical protein
VQIDAIAATPVDVRRRRNALRPGATGGIDAVDWNEQLTVRSAVNIDNP